jgi:hypothetical protein
MALAWRWCIHAFDSYMNLWSGNAVHSEGYNRQFARLQMDNLKGLGLPGGVWFKWWSTHLQCYPNYQKY